MHQKNVNIRFSTIITHRIWLNLQNVCLPTHTQTSVRSSDILLDGVKEYILRAFVVILKL